MSFCKWTLNSRGIIISITNNPNNALSFIREVPESKSPYICCIKFEFPCYVLLMEEIPNNHLGCKKPGVNNKINYQPQLDRRISEPSTVCMAYLTTWMVVLWWMWVNLTTSILGYLSTACSLRRRWCQLHRSSHDARHRPRHRPGAAAAARAACKQSMSS